MILQLQQIVARVIAAEILRDCDRGSHQPRMRSRGAGLGATAPVLWVLWLLWVPVQAQSPVSSRGDVWELVGEAVVVLRVSGGAGGCKCLLCCLVSPRSP